MARQRYFNENPDEVDLKQAEFEPLPPEKSEISRLRDELTSKKLPYGDELGDQAVKKAQRDRDIGQSTDRVSQALYSGFTRQPLSDSYFARGEQEAGQGIGDIQNRREMQDQEQKKASMMEEGDPKSKRNTAYREFLRQNFPDIFQHYPDDLFSQITIADRDAVFDPLKLRAGQDAHKASMAASDAQKAEADARKAEADRELERLKQTGHQTLQTDDQEFRGPEKAKDRDLARELARKKGDAPPKEDARALRIKLAMAQNQVYGFTDVDPNHPRELQAGQASELQKSVSARDQALDKVAELQKLHRDHPHPLPNSAELAEMRSLVAELMPNLAAVNGFQLTQGHQHLQDEMVSDPGRASNYVNSGVFDTQLGTIERAVNSAVSHHAASMGKRQMTAQERETAKSAPATDSLGRPQAGGSPASTGMVHVQKGSENLWIDRSELKDAERDGYTVMR